MPVLEKDGARLVESVETARSFMERAAGLMGRPALPVGSALLIYRCPSIHTFFMRFDLDLVFLDRDFRVVKVVRNVAPFRLVFGGAGAAAVVEMTAGWLPSTVAVGDLLSLA